MFKATNVVRGEDPLSEGKKSADYFSMRRKWYQRVAILKDGSLQGWVVNSIWTFFTMIMLGLGFFITSVRWGWERYGGIYATIYLGGMAAWFAYKLGKTKLNGGQDETVAQAIEKVVAAMKKE